MLKFNIVQDHTSGNQIIWITNHLACGVSTINTDDKAMKTQLLTLSLVRISSILVTLCVFSIASIANTVKPISNPTSVSVDVCSNNEWFDVPVQITQNVQNCIGFDIELQFDKNIALPTGTILLNNSLIESHFVSYMYSIHENAMNITIYLNGKGGLENFNGKGTIAIIEFQKVMHFETPFLITATVIESYETFTQKKTLLPIQCIESVCGAVEDEEFEKPIFYGFKNDIIVKLEANAYPNPVMQNLKIESNQVVTVVVKDASNQIKGIYSNISANTVYTIDMSGFQSGVYFITIYNSAQSKKLYIVKS